ncbi:ornithine decarboxylase [Iris pallida]|uniref:Ornithine decarboxylase n=1 Tax=Iris pallida TaxID=29817 RepID=A0AAX6DM31_IRIPA|nr:ornithine decarboxylase [Iris pallida]
MDPLSMQHSTLLRRHVQPEPLPPRSDGVPRRRLRLREPRRDRVGALPRRPSRRYHLRQSMQGRVAYQVRSLRRRQPYDRRLRRRDRQDQTASSGMSTGHKDQAVGDANVKWDLGNKYGALPGEVVPLLEAAKSAGLAIVGVSFHIGSKPTRMEAYRGAIAGAKAAFDAAEGLGMAKMTMLDIGGGFMARRQFDEAAEIIGSALAEHFADRPELTVIAEPGRFFAETPFTLATNIIGRRVRGELREYWINDGLFGSLNHKAYDKSTVFTATPLALSSDRQNPTCEGKETYVSTVFGPTLDSTDMVLTEHRLPELRRGTGTCFQTWGRTAHLLQQASMASLLLMSAPTWPMLIVLCMLLRMRTEQSDRSLEA